ncbi:MAG: PAS domain-containing protein [Rhodobacteraceae bacterium]|nr:PAS domain-containing protein [Paracoccaceae bacterium]
MNPARRDDVDDELVGSFWDYWAGLPRQGLIPSISDYLDRVPAKLQPAVAIIDAYSPTEFKVRLFGTALVELLGKELTGGAPLDMYAEAFKAKACEVAWESANRPCGYLCIRRYRNHAGVVVDAPGISLPVDGGRTHRQTMLNFTSLYGAQSRKTDADGLDVIEALTVTAWIDVGAGIPS